MAPRKGIRNWLFRININKQKRLPQQARPSHPQRRLRVEIKVKEGNSSKHYGAIIQHFFQAIVIIKRFLR
jgi:hypothetical protein